MGSICRLCFPFSLSAPCLFAPSHGVVNAPPLLTPMCPASPCPLPSVARLPHSFPISQSYASYTIPALRRHYSFTRQSFRIALSFRESWRLPATLALMHQKCRKVNRSISTNSQASPIRYRIPRFLRKSAFLPTETIRIHLSRSLKALVSIILERRVVLN